MGAAALTARLLAFSRGAVMALEVVDARQALSGLTDLLPRALGSGIELDVQLEADLPPIMAAPVHLGQIPPQSRHQRARRHARRRQGLGRCPLAAPRRG